MRGGVALHALVDQCRSRDGLAQWFQPLALVGAAAHGYVQAGALMVCTGHLGALDDSRDGALHREHLLPGLETIWQLEVPDLQNTLAPPRVVAPAGQAGRVKCSFTCRTGSRPTAQNPFAA